MVHQGTLRSGDHLQCDGDVLVYGDINPGAKVSASGDVMVWGRLRGIAHAGKDGSTQARIIAMHLRPVQLRIAEAVARGPEDLPQDGFAEQARQRITPMLVTGFRQVKRHPRRTVEGPTNSTSIACFSPVSISLG